MAAGVLIGILVLSLWAYLFAHFGSQSAEIYDRLEEHKLTEYNAQYTIYAGKTDVNIYDIITLANKAHQNNEDYSGYTDFESSYKVTVSLTGIGTDSKSNLQDTDLNVQQNLIKKYNAVNSDANIKTTFKCLNIAYHPNGKIKSISFTKN